MKNPLEGENVYALYSTKGWTEAHIFDKLKNINEFLLIDDVDDHIWSNPNTIVSSDR